jgi:vinculin
MALERLNADCLGVVDKAEKLGVIRPAHTIAGKIDQAQRWISSPQIDDMGVGQYYAKCPANQGFDMND